MNTQLPMTIAERRRTRSFGLTAELAKGGFAKPAHISIKGNRFTLVSAQGDETPWQSLALDVVIAGFNPVSLRTFYDPSKPYNPNASAEDQTPLCSSEDGVGPREGVLQPQSSTCAQCPRNAWGSDPRGGKGKACSEYKRLAAVVVGDPNPLAGYMFGISGGSHKNLRDYAKFVSDLPPQGAVKPELENVVTRVEFESQGVLKFTAIGWPDAQTNDKIDKLAEMGLLDQVVGLGQGAPALPAPQPVQALPPVQQFQQPAPHNPFAPPSMGYQTSPFSAPPTSAPPVGFGAPPAPVKNAGSEPPKRHRRTKAEMEAERLAAMQSAPTAAQPQFGLVPTENAPRPDAALAAAITDVLGLPTEE